MALGNKSKIKSKLKLVKEAKKASTLLKCLSIRNLATIEFLELEFQEGLNVITGETGTGKSTILSAIALILGERADTNWIRSGCEELRVEAVFERPPAHDLNAEEDGDLIIRRTVTKNGKGKILINGHFATRGELSALTQTLVDLCSQHEHQTLSKPIYQLALLDNYLGLEGKRIELETLFHKRQGLLKELESLEQNKRDLPRLLDFLQFQISEINAADLQADEEESLLQLKQKLVHGKSLSDSLDFSLQHLSSSETTSSDAGNLGALESLQIVHRKLSKSAEQHSDLAPHISIAEQALSVVEDLFRNIMEYRNEVVLDPEALQQVQERLSLLQTLKRKYGSTLAEVIATRDRLATELESLTQASQNSEELKISIQNLEHAYMVSDQELSKERKRGALLLEKSIQSELNDLKMAGVEFKILFSERAEDSPYHFSVTGIDDLSFCFAPNQGEGLKPISKIASGGELSRIMLAVRRVIANQGGIGVYLFDEIDAGIGGQTATVVGKKLRSVADHHQVICITHLPQIAAFAESHHRVEKRTEQNRTFTNVRLLKENEERIGELARMSGAEATNKKTRAHVLELLRMAQK